MRYIFGGRLIRNRDWVYHDLTDSGWRLRALGRLAVQLAPVVVVFALLPGPGYVHWMLPLFLVLTSGFVAAAYGEDLRDRRLRQHGFPPPRSDGRER